MFRFCALALLVCSVAVAGCGGSSSGTKTSTTKADVAKSTTATPTATAKKLDPRDALYLLDSGLTLARYCAKKVLSQDGQATPPTAKETQYAKNVMQGLGYLVRDNDPTAPVANGKTVMDYIEHAAEILRNQGCDPKAARTLTDAAISAGP